MEYQCAQCGTLQPDNPNCRKCGSDEVLPRSELLKSQSREFTTVEAPEPTAAKRGAASAQPEYQSGPDVSPDGSLESAEELDQESGSTVTISATAIGYRLWAWLQFLLISAGLAVFLFASYIGLQSHPELPLIFRNPPIHQPLQLAAVGGAGLSFALWLSRKR